jgi:hypothetical protein
VGIDTDAFVYAELMEDYLGPLEGERETIIGLPKTLTMDLLLQADADN